MSGEAAAQGGRVRGGRGVGVGLSREAAFGKPLENAWRRLDFKPSGGFRGAVFLRAAWVWVLTGFIGSALAGASGSIRWLSRPAWTFSESSWALLAAL